jgi:hypothetical protein
MFSEQVYPMIAREEMFARLVNGYDQGWGWGHIEYNDLDFWWDGGNGDPDWFHNWYSKPNWSQYLSRRALDVLDGDRYAFYTCHGWGMTATMKSIFKNAKIISVVPDLDLLIKNHQAKRPPDPSKHFPEYDPRDSFNLYTKNTTPFLFYQKNIYNEELFKDNIQQLASQLHIVLDMSQVLKYREAYLDNKFNKFS